MEKQHDIIGNIRIVREGLATIGGKKYTFLTGTELEKRIIKAEKEQEICKFGILDRRQIKSVVTI